MNNFMAALTKFTKQGKIKLPLSGTPQNLCHDPCTFRHLERASEYYQPTTGLTLAVW
jgi:hypothetical protein